jgi:hypothetical protein
MRIKINSASSRQPRGKREITLGIVLCEMDEGLLKRRIRDACLLWVQQVFCHLQVDELSIDLLHQKSWRLLNCLKNRGCSTKQLNRYRTYLTEIFTRAGGLGWKPDSWMSDEWLVLFQKSDSPGCVELVRHFSVLYVNPSAVRIEEIIAFTDQCVTRREQTILSAEKMQWGFQNLLIANKYVEVNPIAAIRRNKCGTSIKKFPEDLRQEAEDFFSFMASDPNSPSLESSSSSTLVIGQDVKVLKRRKASSKVTIEHLERILGEVYGFLVERKHPPIKQLSQMFTRTVFERYGNYLKEREVQPNALRHTLLAILTAARQ